MDTHKILRDFLQGSGICGAGCGGVERTQSPSFSGYNLFHAKESQGHLPTLFAFSLLFSAPFSLPSPNGCQSGGGMWAGGREGASQCWWEIEVQLSEPEEDSFSLSLFILGVENTCEEGSGRKFSYSSVF